MLKKKEKCKRNYTMSNYMLNNPPKYIVIGNYLCFTLTKKLIYYQVS